MTKPKIKWLTEFKGDMLVAPEFGGDRLRPFEWTLLKSAEPSEGKPRENVSGGDLIERAESRIRNQMEILDLDHEWREVEFEGAETCLKSLIDGNLLWKKESAAARGRRDPSRKPWTCPQCGRKFRRSRDLANHLTDRRTHNWSLEQRDNYIRKARQSRIKARREHYKSSLARSELVDKHLNPDLNLGPLAGGPDHRRMIGDFMERSKNTTPTDWAHRGSKRKSNIFPNGAPDIIRVKPAIEHPCKYDVVEENEVKKLRATLSPYWAVERPYHIEFIAPPTNKKKQQIIEALTRGRNRTLILVAEDGYDFLMDVVEKNATGPVRHIASDPATNLKLYRRWEPGRVMVKAPKPGIPRTPEETYESIGRLLSLGFDNTAYIRTMRGSHYLYMRDSEGSEKSAGKVCPDFWFYALEERTFRTMSYIYEGEVKGKNFSRVEWTREETDWKKKSDLLRP